MKKKMITLIITTLVLGGAVFGAVSAVYAQKTDTNVREDALVEPAVYRGAWAGNGGCRGACNGTCDLRQDQTHLRQRLQDGSGENCPNPEGCTLQRNHWGWDEGAKGKPFQHGKQGNFSCPESGTCAKDQTQSRLQLRDGSCGAEPGTGAGARTRAGKGN